MDPGSLFFFPQHEIGYLTIYSLSRQSRQRAPPRLHRVPLSTTFGSRGKWTVSDSYETGRADIKLVLCVRRACSSRRRILIHRAYGIRPASVPLGLSFFVIPMPRSDLDPVRPASVPAPTAPRGYDIRYVAQSVPLGALRAIDVSGRSILTPTTLTLTYLKHYLSQDESVCQVWPQSADCKEHITRTHILYLFFGKENLTEASLLLK